MPGPIGRLEFHHRLGLALPALTAIVLAVASCAPAAAPTPTPAPAKPAAPAPTTAPAAPAPTAATKPAAPAPTAAAKPAAPAATAPASTTRDKVKVRATWKISGQDSPFWLGLDKGFYAEQGIDAEVNEGSGSATALQTVASGADDFTVRLDHVTMMKAIGNGLPVKSVATLYQRSPVGVAFHEKANVKSLKDVEGKTIHLTPGSAEAQIFPVLAKANGVDLSKVTIVNLDPATGKQAFLAGRADGMGAFATNDKVEFTVKGTPVTYLAFGDYAPLVGNGVVTSEKMIKEKPDLVKRFNRAIQKTWAYAIEHPEETADLTIKRFPALEGSRDVLTAQVKSLKDFSTSEQSKNLPWGTHQKEQWEKAQDFLIQAGMVEKKLAVDQYFTNEVLP